ncbi:MAG: hypothetical protein ACOZQL_26320 [Myxococcota bacterium]
MLQAAEVRALSSRTWSGATDEVFDATWLSLAGRGFEVRGADRLAGTLVAVRDGRAWEVDVAALGTEQRVTLTPTTGVTRAELSSVLDGLEEDTARLLRAWRELPEWRFDGRRNTLGVPGFSAQPPREWAWLDYDVSRREVTVQRLRARTGPNASLLVEVDRTRPRSQLAASAQRTIGLALGARQRLTFPDELRPGALRVLDGTTPKDVAWWGLEETLGAAQVRLTMACPAAEADTCAELWKAVQRSVVLSSAPR